MKTHVFNGASGTRIGAIESVKMILFTCEDGAIYGLPLKLVAESRAKHYAENDRDTTFESEVEYVMKDPYEGISWFRSQHDPRDFSGKYILIEPAPEKTIEEQVAYAEASISYRQMFVPKDEDGRAIRPKQPNLKTEPAPKVEGWTCVNCNNVNTGAFGCRYCGSNAC